MARRLALVAVHGMGKTDKDFNRDLVSDLKDRLGKDSQNVHFGKVYYQDILKPNEERVWNLVGRKVRWDALRKFLLFGIADAAGLESDKDGKRSDYCMAQVKIASALLEARRALDGNGPLIVLAQSLGGQVVSNYFWDANLRNNYGKDPSVGIWKDINAYAEDISPGKSLSEDEVKFIRGDNLVSMFTTGCNIPIFVAAHAKSNILPFKPLAEGFEWHNFYDQDDVLGWPLSCLSDEYKKVVVDHPVNAGGGILGWILKSWNPLSHLQYWADREILDPLVSAMRKFLHA